MGIFGVDEKSSYEWGLDVVLQTTGSIEIDWVDKASANDWEILGFFLLVQFSI